MTWPHDTADQGRIQGRGVGFGRTLLRDSECSEKKLNGVHKRQSKYILDTL